MDYQEINQNLLSLADPDIAEHSLRFFKTAPGEYGFGDRFLGIRVPVLRQLLKQYQTATLADTAKLLRSEYHEIRLFALQLLVARFSGNNSGNVSGNKSAERDSIFKLYLDNTKYINNWDLVDCSAHKIVGPYLDDRDRSLLYELAASSSLWERRIAMIATLHYIRHDRFEETLAIAEQLLDDKEDLIHKAVGWMLREIGKRDMATEISFLRSHYQHMPRTMLRYAIEKFSKEERHRYLSGTV